MKQTISDTHLTCEEDIIEIVKNEKIQLGEWLGTRQSKIDEDEAILLEMRTSATELKAKHILINVQWKHTKLGLK